MMKNIILLFLSEMHTDRTTQGFSLVSYQSDMGELACVQTNEPAVKYLLAKLESQSETLDKIFLFATQKTRADIGINIDGELIHKTHVEWFMDRLLEDCPQLAGKFMIINYYENEPVESSIAQIASMAQEIKNYAGSLEEHAVLHADMTGGFRHTSMMMLSVMQLLKYSGLKIGSVIYANYQKKCIENVTDIHRVFGLVSGAEEFINFGSVKAIQEYFNEKPELVKSKELQELLEAISEFSDAIRICRTGRFEELLQILAEKINAFEAAGNKTLQEKLFAEIIETIKAEYSEILAPQAKRNDIISWCMRKGFLQQAMTLCTEWIPLQIVSDKVYYPANKYQAEIIAKCKELDMGYKMWQTVFANDFVMNSNSDSKRDNRSAVSQPNNIPQVSTKPLGDFRHIIYTARLNNMAVKLTEKYDTEHIRNIMAEIEGLDKFSELQLLAYDEKMLAAKFPTAYRIVVDEYKSNRANFVHNELYFVKKHLNRDSIFKRFNNMNTEFMADILAVKLEKAAANKKTAAKNSLESIEKRWQTRKNNVEKMLKDGYAQSAVPETDMYEILRSLHWLRSQRNQINHAYDGTEVASSREIIAVINKSLELLGGVVNE